MIQNCSIPHWLSLAFCCVALSAQGQTILELKNGDRISGGIVSESAGRVVISNAWSGELVVRVEFISRRMSLPVIAALPLQGTVSTNGWVVATNAITVATTNRWQFELQAGVNMQFNQKNSESYSGDAKITYTGLRLRHGFEYKADYGRSDNVDSANRMSGELRSEADISKSRKVFVFDALVVGYDSIRKVDLVYDSSVGIGYKLVNSSKVKCTVDSGINYQEEFFADRSRKNFVALRLGETFAWAINNHVAWDEKIEFYPRLTEWNEYRACLESNLKVKLTDQGRIFLNLSVIDIYDTIPAQDVSPNDFQLRSSIGVKF